MLPKHIAIVMDGNGRWAKRRMLPRIAGHRAGQEAVRRVVRGCAERGVQALTLFAFSSENWRRPEQEVSLLMELFLRALQSEVGDLHKNSIRVRVIGERSAFAPSLQREIEAAEQLTQANTGLSLVIAANYGGRWDITQAARQIACRVEQGQLRAEQVTTEVLASCMALHDLPEPDLLIRTAGEQRISNFLLWQLAYTELYFTDTLWPDFDIPDLEQALAAYASRQRRFGYTDDQIAERSEQA
ncbi:MAG TPA: isoprenyl transferase [Gammaproteobacteria bacterium]|nr:isoprenyl transferase [Gammaproteobacteria bacterium]